MRNLFFFLNLIFLSQSLSASEIRQIQSSVFKMPKKVEVSFLPFAPSAVESLNKLCGKVKENFAQCRENKQVCNVEEVDMFRSLRFKDTAIVFKFLPYFDIAPSSYATNAVNDEGEIALSQFNVSRILLGKINEVNILVQDQEKSLVNTSKAYGLNPKFSLDHDLHFHYLRVQSMDLACDLMDKTVSISAKSGMQIFAPKAHYDEIVDDLIILSQGLHKLDSVDMSANKKALFQGFLIGKHQFKSLQNSKEEDEKLRFFSNVFDLLVEKRNQSVKHEALDSSSFKSKILPNSGFLNDEKIYLSY